MKIRATACLNFLNHQTHLALLQTISPGNSESAIVGRQSKRAGRESAVFGRTALCTTSRGTNRRHRLLGNSPPPRTSATNSHRSTNLLCLHATGSKGCKSTLRSSVSALNMCGAGGEVIRESWRQCWQIHPCMKLYPADGFSTLTFATMWSQEISKSSMCLWMQSEILYKQVKFCYLCWILFSHLGLDLTFHSISETKHK